MNKNNSHNKIASILLSILAGVMLCASLTLLPPGAGEGLEPVNVEMDKTNAPPTGMPDKPMNDDNDDDLINRKK